MNIGTLTGQIELQDQLTSKLTSIVINIRKSAERIDGALGAIAIGAGAVTAAVLGAVGSVVALGAKGSTILGVEQAFDRLAESVGATGEALIGGLNKGLRTTVDSMTLMQTVNRALSAGVKLTEVDMEKMGSAARALGKATGRDSAYGVELLSSALATGRVRGLQLAGMTVDVAKAEKDLAASLRVTVDQLSHAGKLEAARIAILGATRSYVDRLGESQLSLKERIQQLQVATGNWFDSLAKGVARSTHLSGAFDAIQKAISDAFGGGSQTMLQRILGWIDRFADAAARYGPVIIRVIGNIKDGVIAIWRSVQDAWNLVPDWFKRIAAEAALAGGAVYVVSRGFGALGGPELLGTIASFAPISSGLSDLTKAGIAGVPIIRNIGSAIQGLSIAEVVSIGVTNLALSIKALTLAVLSSPLALVALAVGAGIALGKLSELAGKWTGLNKEMTETEKTLERLKATGLAPSRTFGGGMPFGKLVPSHDDPAEEARKRLKSEQDALLDLDKLRAASNERLAANLKAQAAIRAAAFKADADFSDRAHKRIFDDLEQNYKDQQAALVNNLNIQEGIRRDAATVRAASADAAGVRAIEEIKKKFQEVNQYTARNLQATADRARVMYEEVKARAFEFGAGTIQIFKDVADAAQRAADKARGGWAGFIADMKQDLAGLNAIFQAAFEGGGGVGGAVQSYLTGVVSRALKLIPVVGEALSQFAGAFVAGAKRIWTVLTGGPSEAELAARKANQAFAEMLAKGLSAQQRLEAGGVSWKQTNVAVRDLYLSIGKTAAEASDVVRRMWAAERQGAEAVKAVQEEINRALELRQTMADSMDKLTSAEDRYHFTAIAASNELWESLQTLLAGQRDEREILHRMSGDFGKLASDAIKFGTTLDERMRDPIQKLIEMGEITLEDGTRLQDINRLTFGDVGEAGKSAIDKMTMAVDRLVAAIKLSLHQALTDVEREILGIGRAIDSLPNRLPDWNPDAPNPNPDAGGYGATALALRPSVANVLPFRATGGTAIINIDRREFARVMVPVMKEEEKRYGFGG